MLFRQTADPAKTAAQQPPGGAERSLTLLVEGTAMNVPEIDSDSYKAFRGKVSQLAMQAPDRLPDADKMAVVREIVQAFEVYRKEADSTLKARVVCWRGLVQMLFADLLTCLELGPSSPEAATLAKQIGGLSTAAELAHWRGNVEKFLHPPDADGRAQGLIAVKTTDHSTENDNAAGLRGGGSAVAQVKSILARGGAGFVAVFRLSCLEVINQRFGAEAVQDCLMAVAAFLTASLHGDDAIYHWTDNSLLAVLEGRPSEQILAAELQRIASQNRDTSITVAGRTIMLRVPLAFELTPIKNLHSGEDLYRLSTVQKSKW